MSAPAPQPLQGMADLAAPEIGRWQQVERIAREILPRYGFSEVRTPILERVEVFTRSLGEGTDVVQKEMYVFPDRGGRTVALRPEGTAGVMRFAAARGAEAADGRYYYLGPMFRCERPQAGRKRQFHQLGVEALGGPSAAADAECIALQMHLLEAFGLGGAEARINTRGDFSDHAAVADGLRAALGPHRDELCEDCRRRLTDNPLRALDCKQPACRARVAALPPITSYMAESSSAYLAEVVRLLERLGVPATVDPLLVRGLDYYAHTVWEIRHAALGAQDALAGGGRYRIEQGGRALEGVGFALGLERVVMALENTGVAPPAPPAPRAWLIALGDAARDAQLVLLQALRRRGLAAGMDLSGRSMKAQMRAADRAGAEWAVIRGDMELAQGMYQLKNLKTGAQEMLDEPALLARLDA